MTQELLRLIRANTYNSAMLVHRAYHGRKVAYATCHQCAHAHSLLTEIDNAITRG